LKIKYWLFLTFNSKKGLRATIFSWTFLWIFGHPYSSLRVSECFFTTEVTLTIIELDSDSETDYESDDDDPKEFDLKDNFTNHKTEESNHLNIGF